MRIEAYNQVAQIYQTNSVKNTSKVSATSSARDQFTMSSVGRDYQVAKQALAQASDIREDKVAEVAEKVNSGSYEVSAEDFASKLVEKFNSLSF